MHLQSVHPCGNKQKEPRGALSVTLTIPACGLHMWVFNGHAQVCPISVPRLSPSSPRLHARGVVVGMAVAVVVVAVVVVVLACILK